MKSSALTALGFAAVAVVAACSSDSEGGTGSAADAGTTTKDGGTTTTGVLTIHNCTTDIADNAPAFFKKYFRCVTVTATDTEVTIETSGLPPHLSNYYGEGHPNYAAFDTSRGAGYRANPNVLTTVTTRFRVPVAPVTRNITVTADLVDGQAGSDVREYSLGPAGVAIDSVLLFNATAAPGDDIAAERFTFDSYEAHPAPNGAYHYHSASPGPLEVLVAAGLGTGTTPGSAALELYGLMCDGTVVLGCKELDGTAIASPAIDAQGGHVHDVKDAEGTVHFSGRYHTHVCGTGGGRAYTPEIQFYSTCLK